LRKILEEHREMDCGIRGFMTEVLGILAGESATGCGKEKGEASLEIRGNRDIHVFSC